MIDPKNAALAAVLFGGSVDPRAVQLEKVRSLLNRHMEALGEMVASLESLERMPLVQEAAWVFEPVLQARVYAEAAAQALQRLLAGPQ